MMARLLVVEDSENDRELIGRQLAGKYHVRYASSIAEALKEMAIQEPDAVLIDIGLPDSTTMHDALARLKQIRRSAALVVVSGHATPQLAVEWILGNASGCVSKDKLYTLVHEVERGMQNHRRMNAGEQAIKHLTTEETNHGLH